MEHRQNSAVFGWVVMGVVVVCLLFLARPILAEVSAAPTQTSTDEVTQEAAEELTSGNHIYVVVCQI